MNSGNVLIQISISEKPAHKATRTSTRYARGVPRNSYSGFFERKKALNIKKCLTNISKTAYGFGWNYKLEYVSN
jgi:hypothetical protein